MINRIQKLKDKLDELLQHAPLDSQEALSLSCEIDRLIVEYYRSTKKNLNYLPIISGKTGN